MEARLRAARDTITDFIQRSLIHIPRDGFKNGCCGPYAVQQALLFICGLEVTVAQLRGWLVEHILQPNAELNNHLQKVLDKLCQLDTYKGTQGKYTAAENCYLTNEEDGEKKKKEKRDHSYHLRRHKVRQLQWEAANPGDTRKFHELKDELRQAFFAEMRKTEGQRGDRRGSVYMAAEVLVLLFEDVYEYHKKQGSAVDEGKLKLFPFTLKETLEDITSRRCLASDFRNNHHGLLVANGNHYVFVGVQPLPPPPSNPKGRPRKELLEFTSKKTVGRPKKGGGGSTASAAAGGGARGAPRPSSSGLSQQQQQQQSSAGAGAGAGGGAGGGAAGAAGGGAPPGEHPHPSSSSHQQHQQRQEQDDDDRDDGHQDPLVGEPEAEGCCPKYVRQFCQRLKDLPLHKGGLNGRGNLCPHYWPDFIKHLPNPTIHGHDHANIDRFYAPEKVVFWDPQKFWPQ